MPNKITNQKTPTLHFGCANNKHIGAKKYILLDKLHIISEEHFVFSSEFFSLSQKFLFHHLLQNSVALSVGSGKNQMYSAAWIESSSATSDE